MKRSPPPPKEILRTGRKSLLNQVKWPRLSEWNVEITLEYCEYERHSASYSSCRHGGLTVS